jgi:hypothetical protein
VAGQIVIEFHRRTRLLHRYTVPGQVPGPTGVREEHRRRVPAWWGDPQSC